MNKVSPREEYMRFALQEAYKGFRNGDGGPFGCCIVKGETIIASAHNTVLKENDPTCHAEINAIRKAVKKLKQPYLRGCILYTTTEPCPMCFSAIHWAQIGAVVFGTQIRDAAILGFNELKISAVKMRDLGQSNIEIYEKFMCKECKELLEDWKVFPQKNLY